MFENGFLRIRLHDDLGSNSSSNFREEFVEIRVCEAGRGAHEAFMRKLRDIHGASCIRKSVLLVDDELQRSRA